MKHELLDPATARPEAGRRIISILVCLALSLLLSCTSAVFALEEPEESSPKESESPPSEEKQVGAGESQKDSPPEVLTEEEKASLEREQAQTAQTAEEAGVAIPEPERPKMIAELRRDVLLVQREQEELVLRIGDKDPTVEQQKKAWALTKTLTDLRSQLAKAQERTEQKLDQTSSKSFKAKWMRVRRSLEDFSNYDVDDGMFRIHIGVRLQVDATTGWETSNLEAQVGSIDRTLRFRRGRVFALGRLLRRFDFHLEYDFAADQGFKDVFLEGAKFTKYFKWRIGIFKEPFSLSRQTSANYLGMLEWPLPVQAIAPGRNFGLMFRHSEAKNRLFWAVSLTTNTQTTDDNRGSSKVTMTGRITWLPMYKDSGRRLVHVGLSLSRRSPEGDSVRLSARPEARFAPFFADTGSFPADRSDLASLEFATVRGVWWVQAEWMTNQVARDGLGDAGFGGWYAEAGWFLTGENRFYRTQDGTFGRLTPNKLFHGGNPFTGKGDGGALEVTGRYSAVDLDDSAIQGGRMHDLSLGMNWYLTQTSRFMLNYIHSNLLGVGSADLVLIRFQFNP